MENLKRRVVERRVATRIADTVVLLAAWTSVLLVSNITIVEARSNSKSLVLVALTVAITLVEYQRKDLYESRPALPRTDEISRLLRSVVVGTAALIAAVAFLDWNLGAWEVLTGFAAAATASILTRGLIRAVAGQIEGKHRPQKVVIVGSGKEAGELAEVIADHPESRFELVGIIGHLPVADKHGLAHLWLGPTQRLIELMHVHETEAAIVTPTGFRAEQFKSITQQLFKAGFDVHLSTGVSRLWAGRFDVRSLAHEPIVVMSTKQTKAWQRLSKRVLDIIGAAAGLIVAAPFLLITALAIKVEDGGPVLFRQQRAGRRAEFFDMLKFRSMVVDAEDLKADLAADNERSGPLFKVSDDPRITRVGRFIRETSIDELPQLINVLRGEMSLVGPRPALTEEEAAFDDEHRGRFDVRPGITGLWQVEARRNASFSAYRRLDLHYVENWTFGLDLRILLATTEQILINILMLPLKRILPASAADGVTVITTDSPSTTVIDLRERTTKRLAAKEGSSTSPVDEVPTGG
jgi:exopolysaccharide biosynthesis polyprenyl glycosylphosphotransferase